MFSGMDRVESIFFLKGPGVFSGFFWVDWDYLLVLDKWSRVSLSLSICVLRIKFYLACFSLIAEAMSERSEFLRMS